MSAEPEAGQALPFLGRLDGPDTAALRELATRRGYPGGATIFYESEPAHDVVIVERGDVSIVVTATDGRSVVIDVFGPGALLGELSAIDGGRRSAAAIALVDVDVLTVPVVRFAEYLDNHPRAQKALLQLLAERLRDATRRHLEFGTADALGRVCARLDAMAKRYGRPTENGVVIDSPINQTDLANWAGLSREAVVKALRALRALRWIDNDRNTIVIHDLTAIQARAHT